ncbi:RNA polymerase sigma factor [Rhodopirellula halodulae]|uniref:RNA polymerase sigma factor n=1 Tax=Rhodopirellula halodulae TaxID=2894198 RepID=UPI001E437768|nr:sigma-70 family RNA polymerase sigma factor [Rhodopirellula sp. JC737]MCC9657095.1 sigma-70 family RNA polymerase sigma factor [Rhodopirellula sp. JC737]
MSHSTPFPNRVSRCLDHMVAQGGDAIAGLIDLTSTRLVRFATTVTRNQHDAEDAVQTVLVKVAQCPRMVRDTNQPWNYMLRMVRNESLAIARRKSRWNIVENLTDLLTVRRVDELEKEETIRAVWRALRKLPMEQSEVIVLKIWEQMTFAEIADVLEITLSTSASRYRYGMEKLTHLLRIDLDAEVPSHE